MRHYRIDFDGKGPGAFALVLAKNKEQAIETTAAANPPGFTNVRCYEIPGMYLTEPSVLYVGQGDH